MPYFQKYVVPVRSIRSCLSMGISQAPEFMGVSYPKESSNSSISLSVKRIFRKLLHGNAGRYNAQIEWPKLFFFPCQAKKYLFFNRAFSIFVTKLVYNCMPKLKTLEFLPYWVTTAGFWSYRKLKKPLFLKYFQHDSIFKPILQTKLALPLPPVI